MITIIHTHAHTSDLSDIAPIAKWIAVDFNPTNKILTNTLCFTKSKPLAFTSEECNEITVGVWRIKKLKL